MPPRRLLQLISAWCDGSITRDDFRALESELIESPDSRALYAFYLENEASLEWELSSNRVADSICVDEAYDYLSLVNGVDTQVNSIRTARPSALPSRFLGWIIAAAILVAIGLRVFPQFPFDGEGSNLHIAVAGQPVGRIQELTNDCVWYVEDRASSGGTQPVVAIGETLRVAQGEALLTYDKGATVVLAAPAVYEITSPNTARLIRGKLRGRVEDQAAGFVVNTPRASVVDYGTSFGINVEDTGVTDVVVFEGEVGIESSDLQDSRRLKMGDGVRLDKFGTMSRLVAFNSEHFPSETGTSRANRVPIITNVEDNIVREDNLKYYEIVVGGMREDARAYVDREFHQWNGHLPSGMPSYLLGADFVRMFNDDKIDEHFEMSVTVGRPAMLYVLLNETGDGAPEWLSREFEYTGDRIGLDVGPFVGWTRTYTEKDYGTGVGPGESIDSTFRIWRKRIDKPTTLKLGDNQKRSSRNSNMYAIVAAPLE